MNVMERLCEIDRKMNCNYFIHVAVEILQFVNDIQLTENIFIAVVFVTCIFVGNLDKVGLIYPTFNEDTEKWCIYLMKKLNWKYTTLEKRIRMKVQNPRSISQSTLG